MNCYRLSVHLVLCQSARGQIMCLSWCAHFMFCSFPGGYYLNEYSSMRNSSKSAKTLHRFVSPLLQNDFFHSLFWQLTDCNEHISDVLQQWLPGMTWPVTDGGQLRYLSVSLYSDDTLPQITHYTDSVILHSSCLSGNLCANRGQNLSVKTIFIRMYSE